MWASLPGRIPGGTGSISPRGASADSLDMAMRSSSAIAVMSMRVLVELLLPPDTLGSSFGTSAVLSPGSKPGYLCHHTFSRCSGIIEQVSVEQAQSKKLTGTVYRTRGLTRLACASVDQSSGPLLAVPEAHA